VNLATGIVAGAQGLRAVELALFLAVNIASLTYLKRPAHKGLMCDSRHMTGLSEMSSGPVTWCGLSVQHLQMTDFIEVNLGEIRTH
jgi:hypothetical protein